VAVVFSGAGEEVSTFERRGSEKEKSQLRFVG